MAEGWGEAGTDPVQRVKNYAKRLKTLAAKVEAATIALANEVAAQPIGELLKCTEISVLADLQQSLKRLDEAIEAYKTPAYNAYEAVRKQVLPVVMENAGIETVKVKGVGRVDLRSDIYASAIKGAVLSMPPLNEEGEPIIGELGPDGEPTKEKWEPANLHDWLCRSGASDLIQETVNAASLKALLRRRIDKGQDVPAELIKVTPYTFAVITKG